ADNTTLRSFLQKIESQYGKAQRIWIMDRGIPTEEVLAEMRQADPPVFYLVGTPKGRLAKLEQALLGLPWHAVREGVEVKLLPQDQDLYVLTQSRSRIQKSQGRSRPAPHLPPTGRAHRSPHLRRLHRLLPARDAARKAQAARRRPNPAGGARQAGSDPDARCPLPHDRRSHPDSKPLY